MEFSLKKTIKIFLVVCLFFTTNLSFGIENNKFTKIYNKAYEAYQENNFLEAVNNFEMANKISAFDSFFFLVGHCYDLMEQYQEAKSYYNLYLSNFPNGAFTRKARLRINKIENPKKVIVSEEWSGKADTRPNIEKEQKMKIPRNVHPDAPPPPVRVRGRAPPAPTGMIFVKGGCFYMGDTFGDGVEMERPVHEVCVDDFLIGMFEVTQREWQEVMGENPSRFKGCGDDCPVEMVSWNEVQGYIMRLNSKTGRIYRLPTEAEWEYAARSGGKREKWPGTSNISELEKYAWYSRTSGNKTLPVGQKEPNGLGLYDMSGNVWEWVQDNFDKDYYKYSPKDNPTGPSSGETRVLRGGNWGTDPWGLRATTRFGYNPAYGRDSGGFRLSLSAQN
jgi:formylglycine-generating enzyme required for sulfatase activity